MAFLDSSSALISVRMTKLGKSILATNSTDYKISKFSVSDDEIEYTQSDYDFIGLLFDGLNNSATSTANSSISGKNNISFNTWIYTNGGTNSKIISWGTDDSNRFEIQQVSTSTLRIYICNGSISYCDISNINLDQWYNICLLYDGTQSTNNRKLEIYLDTVKISDINKTFSGTIPSSLPSINSSIVLGNTSYGSNSYFDGTITQLGIWNGLLSETEISNIYSNGKYSTSLVDNRNGLTSISTWLLHENSGSTAFDFFNNGNDLDLLYSTSIWAFDYSDTNRILNSLSSITSTLISEPYINTEQLSSNIITLPKKTTKIYNVETNPYRLIIGVNDNGSFTIDTDLIDEELGYTVYINTNNIDISAVDTVDKIIEADAIRLQYESNLSKTDLLNFNKFVNFTKKLNYKTVVCKKTFQVIGKGIIGNYNIIVIGNTSGAKSECKVVVKI